MQTFLPYPDFVQSAQVLDRQRLGKQRVEAYQILRALRGESKGWVNHPATRMWRGFERMLIRYTLVVCDEWIDRGYKDTIIGKVFPMLRDHSYADHPNGAWAGSHPYFLNDPEISRRLFDSHQGNLVRKLPEHYGPLFPDADPTLAYYWPEGEVAS
jgi:hypothetical protein